ncbi:response regulator [Paenibacillus sp. 1011MAR3C5]|uniref:BTAD domain-containing putative transcriptional regulator n=1 Tax=Paenibacillus sp. 1011MAR3C5 TaxID=1675787 RepID=UPI000E6C6101|nr:BTAD domain-containing putative transcriptional regulator [Paenibacillus sp. 1011MAR3C5]RJE89615.1 response regulator [Paenibacillus sp. 1011MAR3C5]
MLRAIIVDDEPLSVKRLNRILSESGTVDVNGTFLSPLDACEFAGEHPLDIAFLDISMPEIDGMSLSEKLRELHPAMHIVFVTGYDEYAVQAFELNALDYVMKPVTAERVARTLDRIQSRPVAAFPEPLFAVRVFDGLRLFRQDEERILLKLRSPKTEELLAFLIYRGKVSREEIIDTLWSGLEPEKAHKNLNSTLYYIRKAISEARLDNLIKTYRKEIWIEEKHMTCDLYRFNRLVKQIRQSQEASVLRLIEQAEELYTGPFLNGKGYEWADAYGRQLEREFIQLLELAGKIHLEREERKPALHYFEAILKLDPLREDISLEAVRLYIAIGRMNEAIRYYHDLEQLLQQELGTQPDPRIEEAIRIATR